MSPRVTVPKATPYVVSPALVLNLGATNVERREIVQQLARIAEVLEAMEPRLRQVGEFIELAAAEEGDRE